MQATATSHHDEPHASEVWLHAFGESDRQEQLHEDAVAWRNVTGLLFGVVAIGLVIAILAVWISAKI
ncbi:MAG: hypothetical protein KatS3mg110_2469 [Pirellulaceae bacterium]|nr:MAG: hypothetical protein KatS3mg110_2469 [Pirellulaceae bacterium]